MSTPISPAGWYADPTGRHEKRHWNGTAWTDHVFSQGHQSVDALTAGPAHPATGMTVEPSRPAAPATSTTASGKIPVFGARKHAEQLRDEVSRLGQLIDRYGLNEVAELEANKARLRAEADAIAVQIRAAEATLTRTRTDAASTASHLLDLRNQVETQEFGLYDYAHPAEDSVALATQLEHLRSRIKLSVSGGHATQATTNFTFNNSTAKGAKFVRDMSKLMLRSYNAEAENCVKAVRAGNLHTAQARLSKAVEQIARLGTMIDLHITPSFHQLRLHELELANRHLRAVQAEKEADRARREELREQRKAEQELAAEKGRLEKERTHYANTIVALRAKGDVEGADRMQMLLNDVEHAIENVDYRAANIRAGYVYVISNVGAFGPDVVKIGLTRRLDPMDRVNELGDASVPFRFDVHALFFAEDAVGVEAMLHQHFAEQRINRVNHRREYFRATPTQVRDVLTAHKVELLDFTLDPVAEEYRASQAMAPVA